MVYVGDTMRCYPIQKRYVEMFKKREDVLLDLLKRNSMQLDVIVERIDVCDFSMRLIRFYRSSEYELKNNTIIYTNEITNEKSYCILENNGIRFSSLQGFDSFLERYFYTCYLMEEDFLKGKWFSFPQSVEKSTQNREMVQFLDTL